MGRESGRDQGGLQVFRLPDGTIVRPIVVIDEDGNFVDIATGIVLAAGDNVIGGVRLVDPSNDARLARFDPVFKIPISIDIAHSEVHAGHHFEVHIESGIVAVASISCAFRVPPGIKRTHVVVDWKSEDRAHIALIEGATWDTNSGTVLTIYNNNRNSAITSQLEEDKTATPAWTSNGVLRDPTNITGGTALHTDYGYIAKQAGGTTGLPRHEWVLKNNKTYVITITNDAGGNKYLGMVLHWYEHSDE